jgi:hypothetical protein
MRVQRGKQEGTLDTVTEGKITCVNIAPNTEMIREHARLGGFPADRVLEVAAIIDPTTAEWNELAEAAKV